MFYHVSDTNKAFKFAFEKNLIKLTNIVAYAPNADMTNIERVRMRCKDISHNFYFVQRIQITHHHQNRTNSQVSPKT